MPYQSPEQAEARRLAKAKRARELAERRLELESDVRKERFIQLELHFVRGFDELAALLRVSPRAAQEIAARAGFPKPKSIGDRTKLRSVKEVVAWVLAQEEGE